MFKFKDGRQLPPDYRNLKSAGGAVGARKVVSGHYARADSLDKKKLKKYVKALATEAKLLKKFLKSQKRGKLPSSSCHWLPWSRKLRMR